MRHALWADVALLGLLGIVVPRVVDARIVSLVITRTESPTFAGTSFGQVGPYEKLVGIATGEVDPGDPRNAPIADLTLAPRNARGMVEYSTPVYILRPVHSERGNHRLFYDINNRGDFIALGQFNDAPPNNDPTSAADAGNGHLMRQGYTLVFSGWDISAGSGGNRLAMTVPMARNMDGTPVVGLSLEEFVVDGPGVLEGRLSYPAATQSRSQAVLTLRSHYEDQPEVVPADAWEYVDDGRIRLLPAGTPFRQGALYEFTYVAKDPRVAGLAFAGVRDLLEFLHYDRTDRAGRVNPLAGDVPAVYSFSMSQPSRFLHDFLYAGFNADSGNRRVFDGVLSWIGGGSGGFFNDRFAQPGRTHRQHIGRWYPERQFPFADATTFDPATGTCPRIFEVNSENEYWAKAGSLLHTDTEGRDLQDPPTVRHYLLSSLPHSRGRGPTGRWRLPCPSRRSPGGGCAAERRLAMGVMPRASRSISPPPGRHAWRPVTRVCHSRSGIRPLRTTSERSPQRRGQVRFAHLAGR